MDFMPAIMFTGKEEYKKAFKIEYENRPKKPEDEPPATCILGKESSIENAVFIYPEALLKKFDEKGIEYRRVPREELPKILDENGMKYFEVLETIRTDSRRDSPLTAGNKEKYKDPWDADLIQIKREVLKKKQIR